VGLSEAWHGSYYSSTVIASKISEHVDMIDSGHNPVGFIGVRESSGALETGVGSTARETFSSASSRSIGKAVEDYRSPRRFATAEVSGESARFSSAPAEHSGDVAALCHAVHNASVFMAA